MIWIKESILKKRYALLREFTKDENIKPVALAELDLIAEKIKKIPPAASKGWWLFTGDGKYPDLMT